MNLEAIYSHGSRPFSHHGTPREGLHSSLWKNTWPLLAKGGGFGASLPCGLCPAALRAKEH